MAKKHAKKTKSSPAKKKKVQKSMNQQSLFPGPEKAEKKKAEKEIKAKPEVAEDDIQVEESKPARGKRKEKATAQSMANKQREISVSEFFAKNRHLLGFDNPSKALLTTIKEAVDNSLDACEDAHILPHIMVKIEQLAEDRFNIIVEDNGPGIVKAQVPKIFGKLLYGSKFHTLKQSRGQQGIGISAACMYSQLTTGKPVKIISKPGAKQPAHFFEMRIDTNTNNPVVISDKVVEYPHEHGTRIELELQGLYKKGRHSVDGYLQQIALANPHAHLQYYAPKIEGEKEVIEYPRVVHELPKEALEILPHPYGVELGVLIKMAHTTKAHSLAGFLHSDFSRVSTALGQEICTTAGLNHNSKPVDLTLEDAEKLYKAIIATKIMAPPSNCLSPIGEDFILKGLKENVKADFYTATTRAPAVYRGNPFQIEVGLAWGGDMPAEELAQMYRFANRVPLQYQQSACAINKSMVTTAWRNYGVQQSKGALPTGPMMILLHIASAWVPFTSESKEAIAHYPEIIKEMRLAIQDCGRKLYGYLRRKQRDLDAMKKKGYIEKYIPHIGIALKEILKLSDAQEQKIVTTLKDTLERGRS